MTCRGNEKPSISMGILWIYIYIYYGYVLGEDRGISIECSILSIVTEPSNMADALDFD